MHVVKGQRVVKGKGWWVINVSLMRMSSTYFSYCRAIFLILNCAEGAQSHRPHPSHEKKGGMVW